MAERRTPNGCVQTRAGIVIGGAWTPPPAEPGTQAEWLQGLLLATAHDNRTVRSTYRRPSVIPLNNSLLARLWRALRWAFRLRGPL